MRTVRINACWPGHDEATAEIMEHCRNSVVLKLLTVEQIDALAEFVAYSKSRAVMLDAERRAGWPERSDGELTAPDSSSAA